MAIIDKKIITIPSELHSRIVGLKLYDREPLYDVIRRALDGFKN